MSRYIDADMLEKDGWNMQRIRQASATEMIYETKKPTDFPTADVVEVVRCRECKHSRSDEFEPLWCYVSETCDPVKEDHFCGYGERRDG